MGAIILFSAVLGRVFVNESVTPLTVVSLLVLIVAIWTLSLGAGDASLALVNRQLGGWLLAAGVAAACCAGLSYAVLGVVVRYAVAGRASVSVTVMTTSLVGLIALGGPSAWRLGWGGITTYRFADWRAMLLAGLCNFVAYLALTRALQLTSLVTVNALNASQVAMAAVAGVVLFGEVPSHALAIGVGLTVLGLLLMPRRGHRASLAVCTAERRSDDGVQKARKRNSSSASSSVSSCANQDVSVESPNSSDGGNAGAAAWAEE
jgi:drug/metabolite transporter (DMT)-like permease